MKWIAVVPLKSEGHRKSRLMGQLSLNERIELSQLLFLHVVGTLLKCPSVDRILILSDQQPTLENVEWVKDKGGGLNTELSRVRQSVLPSSLLIIHADLPLVEVNDIETLLKVSTDTVGIAPDKNGTGTNALALGLPRSFDLSFGLDSFRLHHAQVQENAAIIDCRGLALDIDTTDDLAEARRCGFLAF
jgi:2-phospho-L-lactate/phosphoenolpyruvate guanylyltransferase